MGVKRRFILEIFCLKRRMVLSFDKSLCCSFLVCSMNVLIISETDNCQGFDMTGGWDGLAIMFRVIFKKFFLLLDLNHIVTWLVPVLF